MPKTPNTFLALLKRLFFLAYVSTLKILKTLWTIQKCLKNTQKIVPDLTSGSDLGCWEPELIGRSLLELVDSSPNSVIVWIRNDVRRFLP